MVEINDKGVVVTVHTADPEFFLAELRKGLIAMIQDSINQGSEAEPLELDRDVAAGIHFSLKLLAATF